MRASSPSRGKCRRRDSDAPLRVRVRAVAAAVRRRRPGTPISEPRRLRAARGVAGERDGGDVPRAGRPQPVARGAQRAADGRRQCGRQVRLVGSAEEGILMRRFVSVFALSLLPCAAAAQEPRSRNRVVFEPREVSQAKETAVTYHALVDPNLSLEELSAQLMAGGNAGVKSVSWEVPKKGF